VTNAELDELTAIAEDLSQSMTPLLLDGDGRFVRISGPEGQVTAVASSDVLAMVTQGERKAHALYLKLQELPRRKAAAAKGEPQA
jgi:hypothetical protein